MKFDIDRLLILEGEIVKDLEQGEGRAGLMSVECQIGLDY